MRRAIFRGSLPGLGPVSMHRQPTALIIGQTDPRRLPLKFRVEALIL
jgi:hypothetical protein